jgi:hypothetical protein
MSVPTGKVMIAERMVKLPDWLTVLFKKCAVLPPARSVNVAVAVEPPANVMRIGPKSAPSIVAPAGYSSPFMMKW